MAKYGNASGNSGVVAYRLGPDWIEVTFRGKPPYRYSHRSAGAAHVQAMKQLAQAGEGLGTYVSRHVHDAYERP